MISADQGQKSLEVGTVPTPLCKVSVVPDTKVPSTSNTDTNNAISKFLVSEKATAAEILWAMESVYKHFSLRGAGESSSLFKIMFPDSAIAAKMSLGRTKVGYLINHGLAPYFTSKLLKILIECDELVLGFDETLNKVSQHQQMDICVRFWNKESNLVDTRYVGSAFLSSTRAVDLLNALKSCFKSEPTIILKIVQMSMDGPHVNWKLFNDLSTEIKQLSSVHILNIGSCGLHVVHNSFKAGMKDTNWNIDDFLYSLYSLFKDVPLRRSEFSTVSKTNVFPLKFCGVRWVENRIVAERALKMLPGLKIYVKAVHSQHEKRLKDTDPSYKRSFPTVYKTKHFSVVAKAVNDRFFEPKLHFFMQAASSIEPFLKIFQTDKPMAPLLFEELVSLIKPVMHKALKSECLNVKSKSLIDVPITDDNLLPVAKVDVGFSAKAAMRNILAQSKVPEKDILIFRHECRSYYVGFLKKMCNRSPLTYPLTRYISCLSPTVALNSMEVTKKRLEYCLDTLVQKNYLTGFSAEKIKNEFDVLSETTSFKASLVAWRTQEQRLDQFWWDATSSCSKDLSHLQMFIRKILILSHGNAALERGFSINKECLVENLLEESLVAQRTVYDAINVAGGVTEVNIDKNLILSARNAYSRYKDAMEAKRRQAMNEDNKKQKKRETDILVKELAAKKAKLLADAEKEAAVIEEQMKDLGA